MVSDTCRYALRKFSENTTVKGLGRIVRASSRLLRALWTFAVLVGLSIAVWQLTLLLGNYFSYTTSTRTRDDARGAAFPSVSLCSLDPVPFIDHDNLTFHRYVEHMQQQNFSNTFGIRDRLISLGGYIENQIPYIEKTVDQIADEFIVDCYYEQWLWADTGINHACDIRNRRYFFSKDYGVCYTFTPANIPEKSGKYPIWKFGAILYIKSFYKHVAPVFNFGGYHTQGKGVKVIVHYPNSFPNYQQGSSVIAAPGQETAINLQVVERLRLDEPYGSCTENRYLHEGKTVTGERYRYTKDSCESSCYQRHVMDRCNCLDISEMFTSDDISKHMFCGQYEDGENNATSARILCVLKAKNTPTNTMKMCLEECEQPCTGYQYQSGTSQIPWPNHAYHLAFYERYLRNHKLPDMRDRFKVYSDIADTMHNNATFAYDWIKQETAITSNFVHLTVHLENDWVVLSEDTPTVEAETLIAQIGGALNLWIGITFMTLVEVLEVFYYICSSLKSEERDGDHENGKPLDASTKSANGSVLSASTML